VITLGDGAENLQEFLNLLQRLHEDNKPVGITEELFVERIAICWWKLARALRFEMGEIRKRLDNVAVSHTMEKLDRANFVVWLIQMFEAGQLFQSATPEEKLSLQECLQRAQQTQSYLKGDPVGIDFLQRTLAMVKGEIQEKGSLSPELERTLLCTVGHCDYLLVNASLSLKSSTNGEERYGPLEQADAENNATRREFVIGLIDRRSEMLEWLREHAEKNLRMELDAKARSLALPDRAATDTLLRYETHLDRQLYRAMDELERRQRRRKGENVPPPLNVNLGRRR